MTVRTHFKIVFRGKFDGTPETWTFSTKWRRNVEEGPDAGLADINQTAVTTALSGLLNTADFQSSVWCTGWRAYQIGTDGKMEGNPLIVDFATGSEQKGTSVARYPTDVSLCVTTEGANRGHARFGRFYLPGPSVPLGSDHRISTANADGLVTKVTAFLKGISDAIDLPGTLESSDMLNISDDLAGTFQTVRNIRIGRVLDRIERRRRSMEEDYRVNPLPIDW